VVAVKLAKIARKRKTVAESAKAPMQKSAKARKRKTVANTQQKSPKKTKKALDMVTTSSSDVDTTGEGLPAFTLFKVLDSFTDPRCDLFNRSLQAEMRKFPALATLTPEDAERDPPDILFGGRHKGYYKCMRLCRVWVLQIFKWLRSRGEWFVKWSDPSTGKSYDGTKVLAHAFVIKYVSLHKPGMSITFSKHGHLKSTSQIFTQIKRQVHI